MEWRGVKKKRMQGKAVAVSLLNASYTNTEELSKTTKQWQKNKKQKPHQGSAPISQLSEKTEKTESNLNKCINTGIVFRVILGLTVEFVNKSLDS